MSAPASNDVYSRITNQVIEAIEAGAGNWRMPWHTDGLGAMRPVNVVSGRPYRGVNVLALWSAADEHGYSSDKWATYKQWQEIGAQVRKGEKSSLIVFWTVNDSDEGGDDPDHPNEGHEARRRIFARGYSVFNAEQVDGYQDEPPPPRPEIERIEHAERFFSALGADVRHGGARAFYRPASDHIQMPPFEAFRDAVAYYATRGHETIHWTGAKQRLDRDMSGRFGSEPYAGEELVAELGAAFLCADLSLENEPRPDHAAYVASWLKALRDDNRAIFSAAAKAQQAIDYLQCLQPQPTSDLEAAQPGRPGQLSLTL